MSFDVFQFSSYVLVFIRHHASAKSGLVSIFATNTTPKIDSYTLFDGPHLRYQYIVTSWQSSEHLNVGLSGMRQWLHA